MYHCPVGSTVEVKSWNNIHYMRASGLTEFVSECSIAEEGNTALSR